MGLGLVSETDIANGGEFLGMGPSPYEFAACTPVTDGSDPVDFPRYLPVVGDDDDGYPKHPVEFTEDIRIVAAVLLSTDR